MPVQFLLFVISPVQFFISHINTMATPQQPRQPRRCNQSPARLQDAVAIDDLHLLPQNVLVDSTNTVCNARAGKSPRFGSIDHSLENNKMPQSTSKRNARHATQRPLQRGVTSNSTENAAGGQAMPSVAQHAVDKLVLQLAQQQAEAARREATLQQLLQRSSQVCKECNTRCAWIQPPPSRATQVNKEVVLDNQRLRQHVSRLQQSNDQLQLEVIGLRTTLQV